MLGILAWLITLNGTYFKEINEGKVASEYSLYNNLSTFLIIIQLGLLFRYLSLTNENTNSKQISYYEFILFGYFGKFNEYYSFNNNIKIFQRMDSQGKNLKVNHCVSIENTKYF